jgi:uncharacterized membrane protein YeaQ/YmgE (transglycosylase-associated protein family)
MGKGQKTTQLEPGQEVGRRTRGWRAATLFVLVPVAALLILLEVVGGILGVRHYLDATDISSKRREWSTIYYVVVGLVGPVVLSVVWFDPLRTGMTRQHRLRLIGVVGSAIGFLAVLLVLPY